MTMKRYILHIALLACVVGTVLSCGREPASEPVPTPEPEARYAAIGLATDMIQSRNPAHQDASTILSLGIFGYSTGTDNFTGSGEEPNIFDNREATRANAAADWIYSPVAYWPLDQSIKNTFFAYSPYTEDEDDSEDATYYAYNDNGTPYLYYEVPGYVSEHLDVLYSEHVTTPDPPNNKVPNVNINYGTNGGEVKYNMKHALNWIRFIIAADREIIGYEDDGNGDPDPDQPIYEDSTAFYLVREFGFFGSDIITAGTLNMMTGAWEDPKRGTAEYEFDNLTDNAAGGVKLIVGENGNSTSLTTAAENSLMVFPQDFEQERDGTEVWFAFTYHENSSVTPNPLTDTEYYITLPFPDVKLARPGTVMTYIVKLSRSGSYIEFHSQNTIEEWLNDPTIREKEVQ